MAEVSGSLTAVSGTGFSDLMAGFPSGVTVVSTFGPDDVPQGMTCTSMCSVSLTPPSLLVCIRRGSPTLAAILARETFVVNLLNRRAQPVAELFASGAPNRFERVRWRPGAAGPQLVADAAGIADCQVSDVVDTGDHVIVVGNVVGLVPPADRPLLRGLRRYLEWPES